MTVQSIPRKVLLYSALLVVAWLLMLALTPRKLSPSVANGFDLEEIVPKEFGEWKVDPRILPIQAVQTDTLADKIYDQTVSRGYRNTAGDLIMLVIAYGRNQSDTLQIHLPEICYAANGFEVSNLVRRNILAGGKEEMSLPVLSLEARIGNRHEPVTYWTRIGDALPTGNLDRQFHKISYGLRGYIPDGVLVRVSSISRGPGKDFEARHEAFIREFLQAVPNQHLPLFIGATAAENFVFETAPESVTQITELQTE